MTIKRIRWVIMRNKRTEIFCGLARNYQFKPVKDIGDTAIKTYLSRSKAISAFIKTYLSRSKAISAFEKSWWHPEWEDFEAVEVMEVITAKDGDFNDPN